MNDIGHKTSKKLADLLSLEEGGDLPPYHQMQVDKVIALENLITKGFYPKDVVNAVVQAVLNGATFDEINSQNLFINSETKIPIVSLRNKVQKIFDNSDLAYEQYCSKSYKNYKNILSAVTSVNSELDSAIARDNDSADFMTLVARLYRINPSILETLCKKHFLDDISDFNSADQQFFITDIYASFKSISDSYFTELKNTDDHYIAQLKESEFATLNHIDDFDKLYKDIIYGNKKQMEKAIGQLTAEVDLNDGEGSKRRNLRLAHKLKYKIRVKMRHEKAVRLSQLRRLKHDIHHVAQYHGLPSCIVKHDGIILDDHERLEGNIDILDPYQSAYDVVAIESDRAKWLVPDFEKRNRRIEKQNYWVSLIVAMLFGLAEGLVAGSALAAFIALAAHAAPILAVVWGVAIVAGICNGALVKRDLFKTLKQLRLMDYAKKHGSDDESDELELILRLFIDKNGCEISANQKITRSIFGLLAICVGLAFGALAFTSAIPYVGAVIAGILAVAVFAGLTSMLFEAVFNLSISNIYEDAKDYLYESFIDCPWEEMKLSEKVKWVLLGILKALKIILAIAIVTSTAIFSFGVFAKDTLNFLHATLNIIDSTARGISTVVSTINAALGFKFAYDNVHAFFKEYLPSFSQSFLDIEEHTSQQELQQTKDVQVAGWIGKYISVPINGFSQGTLFAVPFLLTGNLLLAVLVGFCKMMGSNTSNFNGVADNAAENLVLTTSDEFTVDDLTQAASVISNYEPNSEIIMNAEPNSLLNEKFDRDANGSEVFEQEEEVKDDMSSFPDTEQENALIPLRNLFSKNSDGKQKVAQYESRLSSGSLLAKCGMFVVPETRPDESLSPENSFLESVSYVDVYAAEEYRILAIR